ncbi:uncharacterized protein Z519_09677 [Cladophialophora bantiana CBS 173.52]|uniref:Uncharacterized protein n=1 Tax=Cladophialophora bantiana (strain ATCC 10958 / CBS 173.52 / CDC B-1940 / NIH 8579) TaxID=1442370 RepID=A0A0D2EHM0_CLAB1|nr:uncharacterized protein Z519_09677 [Cladophialophora bantiana CBS 173.52]KIW89521.1 hypothetical protein Z519_09677 [Cladophialophora bantiana CBS 173.52]
MGIKGLLPVLKSIQKHCTLKKFSGQTIGVDAYGWLHRGVVGCAFALALDKPTTVHIDFVLSRVRMLLDFGITPYLVFDGDNLPSKAGTNAARRKKREESRALGLELHKAGKTTQAQQEFQKAIDVTPLMARQLIEELKKLNVQYIVAPYEADAQLVYLEQKGIINGILAEDSDMLVFGAQRLLTKLNQYGELVEIERSDFPMCKDISLAGWTDSMFRRMAILSGCDYLPNIGKLGLKTAHGLVRKYTHIEKILRIVQLEGKLIVPNGYLEQFRHAELTFLHHRVFCPIAQKMVFLNDLGPGMSDSDMPYLGPYVEPVTALGVAYGDLDPFSKRPIQLNSKSLVRPALGERRSQSYASAPELKPKKPIETFFKPQRQPLAELDPNSLTPSPSQQRLLARNQNASWEPRLVSSAPASRRTTTISAALASTTDRTVFLARASTTSTFQSTKRQRLCSDSMDPSPTREVKQSPFFTAKGEEASPLAQKIRKSKKSVKSKFEVFSDHCDGEMLLEPEIQQAASPDKGAVTRNSTQAKQRLPQGPESHVSIPQSSPVAKSSMQPSLSDTTHSGGTEAVREISQDDDPDTFEDLLEYHVRKQNESLMKTFAFQPQESQTSTMRSPGPMGSRQTTSSSQSEIQLRAPRKGPRPRDIQSFGQKVDLQKTFEHQPLEVQQSALRSLNQQSSCGASSPTLTRRIERSGAERNGCISTAGWRNEARGSEDAIIPNSEDENSEAGSPAQKPQFDLSSFAFVSA